MATEGVPEEYVELLQIFSYTLFRISYARTRTFFVYLFHIP